MANDTEPMAPAPPVNDADRAARWVREDMLYKQQLSSWRERQLIKAKANNFRPGSAAYQDHIARSNG